MIDFYDLETPGFWFHDLQDREWLKSRRYYYYDVISGLIDRNPIDEAYKAVLSNGDKPNCTIRRANWQLDYLAKSLANPQVEAEKTLQGLKAIGFDVRGLKLVRYFTGGAELLEGERGVTAEILQWAANLGRSSDGVMSKDQS